MQYLKAATARIYDQWLTKWSYLVTQSPARPLPNASETSELFKTLITLRPGKKLTLTILGLIYGILGLAVPVCHKFAVSELLGGDQATTTAWLFLVGFALYMASRIFYLGIYLLSQREAVVAEKWLSLAIYRQSLQVRPEYQGQKTTGEIVSLISSHLSLISFFLTDLFPAIFTSLIPLLMAPWVLYLVFDVPPWALLATITLALVGCYLMAMRTSVLYQEYKVMDDERLGNINEWLHHMRALRTLGWTEAYEKQLAAKTEHAMTHRLKVVNWANIMNNFSGTAPVFFNIVALGTLIYATDLPLTPAVIFGLLWTVTIFLVVPMRTLPWVFVLYFDAKTSISRIQEFLRLPKFSDDKAPHQPKREEPLGFRIKGLTYDIDGHRILQDIDLSVAPSEFVAIVGDVGSGKSMLLKSLVGDTLARFESYQIAEYDWTDGQTSAYETWLRPLYGYVPQEAFMISGFLAENIKFAYDDYERGGEHTDSKLIEALERAVFGKDFADMKDGLMTPLGERGINLSGGQKQRLEIARTIYHNRPILLLDDAFSALDIDTEKKLMHDLLLGQWRHKTRILVTHRLSVLEYADRVVLLKNGRVAAEGSYEAMQQDPLFQEFELVATNPIDLNKKPESTKEVPR